MTETYHQKIRVSIIGTRGIPARYGGFETFAEEISPLLAEKGFDVTVQCDLNSFAEKTYRGVNLFYTSVAKSDHPIRYYFEGLKYAVRNSDIIMLTSTAGSVFYFLNFFKRRIIITNPDGLEFRRAKWSFFKRAYLKFSEILAVRLTDYIVADSEAIKEYLINSYKNIEKKIRVIEYGAHINNDFDPTFLEKFKLVQDGYYLVVSRLEPENNLDMIINAFRKANTSCPLVIIGDKLNNRYVSRLINQNSSEKIKFIGGIYDRKELSALRNSCKAYIHGHSVGGTNPSLLEAMGSRNIILAHNNEFNREVTSDNQLYFKTQEECSDKINAIEMMSEEEKAIYKGQSFSMIINKYNWNNILTKYLDFFDALHN